MRPIHLSLPEPADFIKDLAWSESMTQWSYYLVALDYFFPTAKDWDRVRDLIRQKRGKDVVLEMPDRPVRVQLKSRRSYYPDIALEYKHQFADGSVRPGWIEELSNVDFILYFKPSGTVHKIECVSLRAAWSQCGTEWIKTYFNPEAVNRGQGGRYYTTFCVAVPMEVLEAAGVLIETHDFAQTASGGGMDTDQGGPD